jgi:uncharacterized protein YqeY
MIEQIKQRVFQAMRDKNELERDLLRVVLGDLQMQETRSGEALSDDEAHRLIRKIVKSTHETIDALKQRGDSDEAIAKARAELVILESMLPQSLDADQITEALADVADAIKNSGNAGQAIGMAMKHLKAAGASVDGKMVAKVVGQLRQ